MSDDGGGDFDGDDGYAASRHCSRSPRGSCDSPSPSLLTLVLRRSLNDDELEQDLLGEGEEGGEEEEEGDADGMEGQDVVDIDAPEDGGVQGTPVDIADRITTPYMTKYERARILGTRALQIR